MLTINNYFFSRSKRAGIYAFVLRWDGKPFTIKSLDGNKVKSIVHLADGKTVKFREQDGGLYIKATGSTTHAAVGFKMVMR